MDKYRNDWLPSMPKMLGMNSLETGFLYSPDAQESWFTDCSAFVWWTQNSGWLTADFLEARLLETLCRVGVILAIISSVIFYLEWTTSNIFITNFLQLTLLYLSRWTYLLPVSVRRQLTHWHNIRKEMFKDKANTPGGNYLVTFSS